MFKFALWLLPMRFFPCREERYGKKIYSVVRFFGIPVIWKSGE